jgi:hypothetical protein
MRIRKLDAVLEIQHEANVKIVKPFNQENWPGTRECNLFLSKSICKRQTQPKTEG